MPRRRMLSVLLLAGALSTVPVASAVADDYPASEYTTTVSDSTPAVGAPFTVAATGPVGNGELTMTMTCPVLTDDQIQIAGTKSMTKPTVDGTASFQVTLLAECGCEVVVYDAAGNVISRQKITTEGFGAVSAATGNSATASTTGVLPKTGVSGLELAALAGAVALLGAGAVGVAAGRRRRVAQS